VAANQILLSLNYRWAVFVLSVPAAVVSYRGVECFCVVCLPVWYDYPCPEADQA
jgi:hypothetical protein